MAPSSVVVPARKCSRLEMGVPSATGAATTSLIFRRQRGHACWHVFDAKIWPTHPWQNEWVQQPSERLGVLTRHTEHVVSTIISRDLFSQ